MSWTFFREFLFNRKATGAIAPSSRGLARCMVQAANLGQAHCILELGPGTGAFTSLILSTMPAGARYLGLDLNATFIERLSQRHPGHRFANAAAQDFDFQGFLGDGQQFDAIVSGLPWTAFPEALQIAILDHVMPHLKPGGVLATFAYTGFHKLPSGQHFRHLLRQHCSSLRTTRTVWRNLPPAFVYAAVK